MHIKEATHLNKPNDYYVRYMLFCWIFVLLWDFWESYSLSFYCTAQQIAIHETTWKCAYMHVHMCLYSWKYYIYIYIWITGMSINHQYTRIPVNSSFGTFSYEHLMDVHSNLNRQNIWKMPAGMLFALISNQHQPASMHSHQIKTMWNIIIDLIVLNLILP